MEAGKLLALSSDVINDVMIFFTLKNLISLDSELRISNLRTRYFDMLYNSYLYLPSVDLSGDKYIARAVCSKVIKWISYRNVAIHGISPPKDTITNFPNNICKQLRSLNCFSCDVPTAITLVKSFPNLESVDIIIGRPNEYELDCSLMSCIQNLYQLKRFRCSLKSDNFAMVSKYIETICALNLEKLYNLTIGFSHQSTRMNFVKNLLIIVKSLLFPRLKSLSISQPRFTDDNLQTFDITTLNNSTNKNLHLNTLSALPMEANHLFSLMCPNLTSVEISSYAKHVDPSMMLDLARNLPNLRKFSCPNGYLPIGEWNIDPLFIHCMLMENLELCNSHVDASQWPILIGNWPRLQSLVLKEALASEELDFETDMATETDIYERLLQGISTTNHPQFRRLEVTSTRLKVCEDLMQATGELTQLTSLKLMSNGYLEYYNPPFTNLDISPLGSLRNLLSLYLFLGQNELIISKGIEEVVKQANHIRQITLSSCEITDDLLEIFAKYCSNSIAEVSISDNRFIKGFVTSEPLTCNGIVNCVRFLRKLKSFYIFIKSTIPNKAVLEREFAEAKGLGIFGRVGVNLEWGEWEDDEDELSDEYE